MRDDSSKSASRERRVRILFLDHAPDILGGAEINLVELLDPRSRPHSWDAAVACPADSPLHRALQPLGVRHLAYGLPLAASSFRVVGRRATMRGALNAWLALRRCSSLVQSLLLSDRADVVVTITNKDHLAAGPAATACGVPLAAWINDIVGKDFFPWHARMALARSLARHAVRSVAVSDFAREALVRSGVPRASTRVFHNGIPLDRLSHAADGNLKANWGIPREARVAGLVGRWTPWKGHAFALDIARQCRRQPGDPWHFAFIGGVFNGEEAFEQRVRLQAQQPDLKGRVHFVPFVQEIGAAMRNLDALLHASLRPEPFGRVIIEAMACGIPVIAARAGGVPEIIREGIDGLLAEPGDARGYAEGLQRLAADKTLGARLAAAAKETVRARFTVERLASDWTALFHEVRRVD